MITSKVLKSRLFGYFQSQGFYEYRRGWLKGDCVKCGAEDKYGIHLEFNRTHCFVCEYSKTPLEVVKESLGVPSTRQVLEFLSRYETAEYRPVKVEIPEQRAVVLPDGFKLLKYGDNRLGDIVRKYITEKRHLDVMELSSKGVGYVSKKSSPYFGYIIFPFYNMKHVIYFFQTRKFYGDGPKFKNPKVEDFGIGKNQVIYNIGALHRFKEIDLCESIFNVLTMGDTGIGINGKVLSLVQAGAILTSPVEIVNILLDDDAWEYAVNIANLLIPYKKVRLIRFPEDQDVNDLGREAVLKLKEASPLISSLKELNNFRNYDRITSNRGQSGGYHIFLGNQGRRS